jgi:hypothetical protein
VVAAVARVRPAAGHRSARQAAVGDSSRHGRSGSAPGRPSSFAVPPRTLTGPAALGQLPADFCGDPAAVGLAGHGGLSHPHGRTHPLEPGKPGGGERTGYHLA